MKHYRSTRKKYITNAKQDAALHGLCNFCDNNHGQEIIEENETAYVISNRVQYDLFDGARVVDHLMVIPKQHRASLADFSDQELLDALRLAAIYEAKGYSVYARGVGSITRSIDHQHTHLIKLADTIATFVVYSRKPYILLDR